MWLLLVAPFLLPYPCVACLKKMCFPPWQGPFLSRHQTLASLAEILCFPALAFQVLCRVTPVSFNIKIKIILNQEYLTRKVPHIHTCKLVLPPGAFGLHQPLPAALLSVNVQLSLCLHREWVPGPLWIPKSTGAQVPYMKWHSTVSPLYPWAPCLLSQLTNLGLFDEEPADTEGLL